MVVNRQGRKEEELPFSQFIRYGIANRVYSTRLAVARLTSLRLVK